MRIIRFSDDGKIKYGLMEKKLIRGLKGVPFVKCRYDGSSYAPNEVRLLPPCLPSKIVCIGLNYRSHAEETKMPIPELPLIFLKPSTAVIGTESNIILPKNSTRVDYEGELAIVMRNQAKNVPENLVSPYILGYTCFNDVTERHNQKDDGQWTRAKGYDTFAPIGPCIETEVSPDDLKIETIHNGKVVQSSRTSDLIFSVPRIVSFISSIMTLYPGDVIATGTPSGIGPVSSGDTVNVRIEKIGTLTNTVVAE